MDVFREPLAADVLSLLKKAVYVDRYLMDRVLYADSDERRAGTLIVRDGDTMCKSFTRLFEVRHILSDEARRNEVYDRREITGLSPQRTANARLATGGPPSAVLLPVVPRDALKARSTPDWPALCIRLGFGSRVLQSRFPHRLSSASLFVGPHPSSLGTLTASAPIPNREIGKRMRSCDQKS
jgi:hypothetical protein